MRCGRKTDPEGGAAAAFALDGDLSAVCLDDLFGDCQADPAALGAHAVLALVVHVEHVGQLVCRDTDARVGDLDHDPLAAHRLTGSFHRIVGADPDGDPAAGFRELEGVSQEIAQHLVAEPVDVRVDGPGSLRVELEREPNALLPGERFESALEARAEVHHVELLDLDPIGPRLVTAQVDQLVHLLEQHAHLLLHRAEHAALLLAEAAIGPFLQHLRVAAQDVDRRLEVVRHDADELGLEAVQLGQLLGHRHEGSVQVTELVGPVSGELGGSLELPLRHPGHRGAELLKRRNELAHDEHADYHGEAE